MFAFKKTEDNNLDCQQIHRFYLKNLFLQSDPTTTALCNHDPVFRISAELSAVIKATEPPTPHPLHTHIHIHTLPSPPAEEESERSAYGALPG